MGMLWLLYIVIWSEHHRNRIYGVLGVLKKKSDWIGDLMNDTPQIVMTTRAPAVLKILIFVQN